MNKHSSVRHLTNDFNEMCTDNSNESGCNSEMDISGSACNDDFTDFLDS